MLFLWKKQFPCNRINIADFNLSYSRNALDYEWDPKMHKPNNNLFSECSHSFPHRGLFLSKHRKNNNNKKVRNSFSCWWIGAYSIVWTPSAVRQWIPERETLHRWVRKQPVTCQQEDQVVSYRKVVCPQSSLSWARRRQWWWYITDEQGAGMGGRWCLKGVTEQVCL